MIDITPCVEINDMSQKNFKTLMLFRCTTLEYANKFLETGNIRFGLPQEWIDDYKKNGHGRGDLLEGVFANVTELDEIPIYFFKTMRPNVIVDKNPIGGYYFFRSEDVLNMRTYCLFGLNDTMFSEQVRAEDKKLYPTGKISEKYFCDLYPEVTMDNYDFLKPDQKPVLLMIKNPNEFFNRIRTFLHKFGLNDNEFIISPVGYVKKYEKFIVGDPMPGELFTKDAAFNDQSEIRIVITSTRKEITDKLTECNGIVDIGTMKDIADYEEYYFKDFVMQLRGNGLIYELPKPIVTEIDDPLQLIGLIHQTLRDELPEPPEDTDEYLSTIIECLEDQFDIVFDRSCLTFHKKDNSQSWELTNIWDTLFLHGFHYFNEKEYEKSIDSYSKAINIDSTRPEAWYNRAVSHYWLRRYDHMFSDMDEAIKLDPTNAKYITERASMLQQLRKV